MSKYKIVAKIPREHLWCGGYLRDAILNYFKLDSSEIVDECRSCYADDFILHTYIFDGLKVRIGDRTNCWTLFRYFEDYICEFNELSNLAVPLSRDQCRCEFLRSYI